METNLRTPQTILKSNDNLKKFIEKNYSSHIEYANKTFKYSKIYFKAK